MPGKHRESKNITRRVAQLSAVVIAVLIIAFAFYRPTQTVSNAKPSPATPKMDLSVSTTTTTTPTPTPTSQKRKRPSGTQSSRRTSVTQDQTHTPVTPHRAQPIKSERTLGPSPGQLPEKDAAPVEINSSAPSPVDVQQEKTKPSTTAFKSAPAVSPKVKTTPRMIPSTKPRKGSTVSPDVVLKATTISPIRPVVTNVVSRVTNNSRCASIGLQPVPKAACNTVLAAFPEIKTVLGAGSRSDNPTSCHPRGLAIDFMVGNNKALGDRLYAYVIARRSALGATPVVLWQVENHFDHVHVSFNPCKG